MQVIFTGRDYDFILDENTNELGQAIGGGELETEILNPQGKSLGKKAILRYGENETIDGMELDYLPGGKGRLSEAEAVRLTINNRVVQLIQYQGHFGTRYNGSDKVTVTVR